jgi:hypothetical protein
MLTPEELHQIFSYDPETGKLYWKMRTSQKSVIGKVAGSINPSGRVIVTVRHKRYKAHRIAWAMMTGKWPDNEIDHINRDPSDNRWSNLREATHAQNMKNLPIFKANKSGRKGVSWHAIGKKWQAHIKADGVNHYLGLFSTVEEAAEAYIEASKRLHGKFSAH